MRALIVIVMSLFTLVLNAIFFVMTMRLGFGIEPVSLPWIVLLSIATVTLFAIYTIVVTAQIEKEEKEHRREK